MLIADKNGKGKHPRIFFPDFGVERAQEFLRGFERNCLIYIYECIYERRLETEIKKKEDMHNVRHKSRTLQEERKTYCIDTGKYDSLIFVYYRWR